MPSPASSSTANSSIFKIDTRFLWLLFTVVVLLIINFIAFTQAPRPNPWQPVQLLSSDWWLYPVERNAFKRLPVIDADIRDIGSPPGHPKLLVAVGSNDFIARSEDNGISWTRAQITDYSVNQPKAGLFDFIVPTAYADNLVQPVPPTPKKATTTKADVSSPSPRIPSEQKLEQAQVQELEQQQQQPTKKTTTTPGVTPSNRSTPLEQKLEKGQVQELEQQQQQQQVTEQEPAQQQEQEQEQQQEEKAAQTGDDVNAIADRQPPNLSKIVFVDIDNAWIVGDLGTILHSSDGGRTWQAQGSGTTDYLYALYFVDALTGWAAGTGGSLLHTPDGGNSWQPQDSGTNDVLSALYFVDSQTGWAAGSSGKLLHTRDGGRTWQTQNSGTKDHLQALSFVDARTGWAAGDKGSLLHTKDGGNSWQAQASGTTDTVYALYFSDPRTGWAAGDKGSLLNTRDGGNSWQPQDSGTTNWLSALYFVDARTGWAAGNYGSLLYTGNGGNEWHHKTSGSKTIYLALYFIDARTGWAAGGNGSLLHTKDGGISWRAQQSGTTDPLTSLYFVDPRTGWAAGDNGTLLYTRDGGNSWQPQDSGTNDHLQALYFVDARTGWAAGGNGTLLHTKDVGNSWQPQDSGVKDGLYALYFVDPRTGWAAGGNGSLLYTRDGGGSWQPQDSGTKELIFALYFVDPQTGWAAGDNGTLLHTSDGGNSWQPQDSGTNDHLQALYFVDARTGWAVDYKGKVLHTRDGGNSWQQQESRTKEPVNWIYFVDARTGWAAGGNGSLLRTRDGGNSWQGVAYERYPAPWYYLATMLSLLLLLPALRRPEAETAPDKSIADLMASDSPLKPGDPDPLQFGAIARSLSRFIRNENTRPPLTIAVTGPWGSGKSSLMNLISGDLRRVGFQPVWFNVWHHQKEEHLLAALLTNIRKQAVPPFFSPWPPFINIDGLRFRYRLLLQRGPRHWLLWMLTLLIIAISAPFALKEYTQAGSLSALLQNFITTDLEDKIGSLDIVVFITAVATALGTLIKTISAFGVSPIKLMAAVDAKKGSAGDLDSRLSFRYRFSREFRDVTKALDPLTMVILVDDLDRCRSDRILEILEAVNFLVSSGNCIVVLGMDYEIVRQSIALEFKSLAEQIKKESSGNGANKAELFAAEYLEKLINIQVPVPQLKADDAAEVLATDTPEPDRLSQWLHRFRSALQGVLPAMVVIAVLGFGWYAGVFLSETDEGSPVAQNATATEDPQQKAEPGRGVTSPKGPSIDPTAQKAELTGKIIVSPHYVSPWSYYATLPIALIIIAAITVALRRRNIVVKDSLEFNEALRIWAEVVISRRNTPRVVKRFLNRTRYFAMRLRDSENIPHQEKTKQKEHEKSLLDESVLVALSAIHQLDPALIGSASLSELESLVSENPILEKALKKHMEKFNNWPPTEQAIRDFKKLSQGIEVH